MYKNLNDEFLGCNLTYTFLITLRKDTIKNDQGVEKCLKAAYKKIFYNFIGTVLNNFQQLNSKQAQTHFNFLMK